jgi:phosphatidylserine synthase
MEWPPSIRSLEIRRHTRLQEHFNDGDVSSHGCFVDWRGSHSSIGLDVGIDSGCDECFAGLHIPVEGCVVQGCAMVVAVVIEIVVVDWCWECLQQCQHRSFVPAHHTRNIQRNVGILWSHLLLLQLLLLSIFSPNIGRLVFFLFQLVGWTGIILWRGSSRTADDARKVHTIRQKRLD